MSPFVFVYFLFTFNILFILEHREIVKDIANYFKGIFFSYKSAIIVILKVQKTAKLPIFFSDHDNF